MKNSTQTFLAKVIIPIVFMFIGTQVNSQSAGFNTSFAVLSINGGANTYYDLQAATGNPDFQGANLGSFNSTNSLVLKGAEHNVYKCGGCDLTSTRVYYRMYLTSTAPGTFSNLNIGYSSGFNNGCGGQDQQWSKIDYSTDILAGLPAGNYTFEIYSDASITCQGGTAFASNGGSNYKATFQVKPVSCTWDGSSWTNTTGPDADIEAIINGTYNTSVGGVQGPFTAKKLTVTSQGSLTVNSGTNLNIINEVINNGSFVIQNNANLIQNPATVVNANTGVINVNRESSPLFRSDYTMWSSPVSGTQTLGEFSPLTSITPTSRFYIYDYSLGTGTGLYSSVPPTTPFATGTGYLIRMPNTWVDFVPSPGPPATPASWAGVFTGKPNNGTVTINGLASNEYYAVGNPYPSTLSMENFINGNLTNISGPLYFWRKTNDVPSTTSYSTCTTAGCSLNNGHTYPNTDFISVGQGFIVQSASSGTLNFTNTMRVADNTNQFFKTKAIEKNRIWINLSKDANPVNQMLLAYMTGATQGIDPAIDGRYINDSQTALNSFLNNEEFAIQGRALPFEATDVVPLAFKTTADGNFTIAIDRVDGLFLGNQEVYLVDSKTGTETNLKTNSYQFTATAGVDNARFSLTFQKTLSLDPQAFNDNSVIVYKNAEVIYVNSGAKMISNIKVFDIQGKLIAERNNVKANTTSIQNLKASNQVLIVQVTNEDNQVISKKVEN